VQLPAPCPGRAQNPQLLETEIMKRVLMILVLFAIVFAGGRSAAGQPQSRGTAMLSGVVLGPNDKPVVHASVSYQYSDGSAPHAVYTDAHGRFTIAELKANSYDIRASNKGVFSEWQRNIPLKKGQAKSLELRLIYAREMPKAVSDTKPKQ
jgi:Carboxypeptidase regulatory-like domain